jgi:hypothetical protein
MRLCYRLDLSCGSFRLDDWTAAALIRAKFRKDGQPDLRTNAGKQWQAYVAEQERKCTEAYSAGEPFTPDRFDSQWRWA